MSKTQTPEEKEKARTEIVESTLVNKLFQNVMGSNSVKSQPFVYGELSQQGGEENYNNVISHEEFTKKRQELYAQKKAEMQQANIAGEPTIVDPEVSLAIVKQLKESMGIAKIGELETYVNNLGAGLDFKVPEELKELSYANVLEAAMKSNAISPEGALDTSKLSDTQKDAIAMYQLFSQAYERACALSVSKSGSFADINAQGSAIADKYKPKVKAA